MGEDANLQWRNGVFHLYFENKSYKEISDALTLEEKKVKSFIQNGKRNLKICIEKNNGKKE